ncbi:protein distal antenna-like [Cylas formicarius]|uniref:protein distal antenna-like n=1 Tax=Cylas formicarius TaxID=197179 RepID=UPI002958BC61|nr:protein distal antenna-like [Cylas formicarius]
MSATKAGKRPLRSLTAHEKLSAIRRVHDGESKASVARDIGVPESTLRGWCKNEEKISFLSRQSSPETDDSNHSNKKIKLDDQPYNLSLKTPLPGYSPTLETPVDFTKACETPDAEKSPLNLRVKCENATTPVSTQKQVTAAPDKEKERERNRAELARLSAELGLNRPEVFLSSLNNTNMNDLTGLLIQWNSIYQQHLLYQQQKTQQQSKNKVTAPADTSTKSLSPKGLLTTVDNAAEKKMSSSEQQSVYDSVSYWLRQQQSFVGFNPPPNHQPLLTLSTSLPSTSTVTNVSSTIPTNTTTTLLNGAGSNSVANQQMKFWNWYKQSAYNPSQTVEKPILYQQLTKDAEKDLSNAENHADEKPRSNGSTKNRSVLDNLLLNNNTIEYGEDKDDAGTAAANEAIEHGEKFLKWLESCSDPSVTTLQILTLQGLIKNLKSGADRKNGDPQCKAKVKRK